MNSKERRQLTGEIHTDDDDDYIEDDNEPGNDQEGEDQESHADSELELPAGAIPRKRISLRPPRAKLDISRILGDKGFPLLLKLSNSISLQGKGNEGSDLNRLLSVYKDWCHGIFPKLPFRDVVRTIEKQCHKKDYHIQIEKWYHDLRNHHPKFSATAFQQQAMETAPEASDIPPMAPGDSPDANNYRPESRDPFPASFGDTDSHIKNEIQARREAALLRLQQKRDEQAARERKMNEEMNILLESEQHIP